MKKVLIANRGEIALRVMKTLKRMGIKTVAVYAEADRKSPHVIYADEAVFIGASPSSESYLRGDKILEAARKTGADAIHPGYGFLSENPDFAEEVEKAGIVFIGPTAAAMRIMGSKLAAKDCVKHYNIPMVPGIDHAITDIAEAKKVADNIGYPILIKASAGGGGKGMRVVEKSADFEEQMNRAVSEAVSAFGDGSVFIEKFVDSPRHIEIQVLADKHNNTVYLFERECSIQRRHQKVIEEAPSSILTQEKRIEMGEAAVKVAQSCGYIGAGTVEFLMDSNLNFYFLEMNTRLQVEHPVTEFITGLDLVEQQIRVARDEKLAFSQNDLSIHGHAIELRVCAEDPYENFLPSIGTLDTYSLPNGDGIRVDDGFTQGMEIPIFYDPLIAKLIVHGKDRMDAISKMKEAIAAFHIEGIATTLPFGTFVMNNNAFITGKFNTHFIQQYFTPEKLNEENKAHSLPIAKIALYAWLKEQSKPTIVKHTSTNWKSRLN
ncbi:MAG: acetyl-CoA carboxylase biotin carboxylase subunit [Ferruginibacter sp.]|nr:acetyl-CoA carboxylase biotin carboxylase subunit [Ferruginibacter sp.]